MDDKLTTNVRPDRSFGDYPCYYSSMLRIVIALIFLSLPSVALADITGTPRIIDGDTIEIAGERIRLHGIDAPEQDQTCKDENGNEWRCGQDATFALARIIEFHWVRCEGDKRDR